MSQNVSTFEKHNNVHTHAHTPIIVMQDINRHMKTYTDTGKADYKTIY